MLYLNKKFKGFFINIRRKVLSAYAQLLPLGSPFNLSDIAIWKLSFDFSTKYDLKNAGNVNICDGCCQFVKVIGAKISCF